MLNIHASGASENRRNNSRLFSNLHITATSLGPAQMSLKTFENLGRCSAFIACYIFVFFLAISSAARLPAQTAGTVSGHVSDSTNAAVPDANISLKNVGTGSERSTVTTGSGDYTFPEVPVGVYSITATHSGFKTAASNNVQVQVQQSVRLDFSLQVGAVTQSIEVEASGALLQAENATLGTVVENQAVNELPLNGRNYLSLVQLSSNANTLSPASGQAGSRLGGDRSTQAIAVGGQRIMFDYYTLDGVNNTDPDFNTYVGLPSLDGIQEFKVQTGVYPAEFGHEASQVNVVSKSGTNTYHGSMYDFIRNNIADANPYYFPYNSAPIKVFPYKWNDYGFELDGAIRIPKLYNGRDKFFFMVDDEWRKVRSINQSSATQFPGLYHRRRNAGHHLRSVNRRRQRPGKDALSQQHHPFSPNHVAGHGVAEILGVKRGVNLLGWQGDLQLFLHHHATDGSPELGCPWRLHPVPEVAVCLPLQLRERRHPINWIARCGQQDLYPVLPVHGFQHLDLYAPHSQRSSVWL
jgi:hypothetical protein